MGMNLTVGLLALLNILTREFYTMILLLIHPLLWAAGVYEI